MDGRRIGISFSLKRARVLIYHDTLRALQSPEFFRFLINEAKRKLAMEVCNYGDDGFHIVPDFSEKDARHSYEIASTDLLRMVYAMCNWDSEDTYRVYGRLYPEERVVEFELTDAQIISDAEFVDPETME